jgi:hypothetical protein
LITRRGQSRSRRLAHISRTHPASLQSAQQISKSNVAQLRMAWSHPPAAGAGIDADRLSRRHMRDGAGASIQALDATNGDLGISAQLSTGRRRGGAQQEPRICEDMIYFGAPDGFLVALDADRPAALGNQGGQRPDYRRMLVAVARSRTAPVSRANASSFIAA